MTAPVLDIGPWNRDDAWWEAGAARGQFQDLPRFVPQVWAAYENGYNGGRDAIGRYVTFPAMIDLADGVYADLGMQASRLGRRHPDLGRRPVAAAAAAGRPQDRQDGPIPSAPPKPAHAAAAGTSPHDERYFSETGYRIDDDAIWSYFVARGRVPVFGFPVSRTFRPARLPRADLPAPGGPELRGPRRAR